MREATLLAQAQRDREDAPYLWERRAEIYLFPLPPNNRATQNQLTAMRALSTSSNRVGDIHKGIQVSSLVQQYRRIWLELLASNDGQKPSSQTVRKAFSIINTKGQDKYCAVIMALVKTSNDDLWKLFEELFSTAAEVKDGTKGGAKSTAPFDGMQAKWGKIRIPDTRKLIVLSKFRDQEFKTKDMKTQWGVEFNKAIFIHYLNSEIKSSVPLDDFDKALAMLPALHQSRVLKRLTEGGKIKTYVRKPLSDVMPPKVVQTVKLAKAVETRAEVSPSHLFSTDALSNRPPL